MGGACVSSRTPPPPLDPERTQICSNREQPIWVPTVPRNHLEERLLDQVQARASYTPPFWGSFA